MRQKPLLISLLISLGTGVIAGFLTFKSMEQYQEMYRHYRRRDGYFRWCG